MSRPEMPCHVFPDGEDWIIFAPLSRIVMRCNASAARRFRRTRDRLPEAVTQPAAERFAPTRITLALGSRCAQRCIYCYGMPAHENLCSLDFDFARRGIEVAVENAAAAGVDFKLLFHGLGEPTLNWDLLVGCVEAAHRSVGAVGIQARISLCTGGQLGGEKADWLVKNIDRLMVSIDGPPEIHNAQRPRADGGDSLALPLELARRMYQSGGRLTVMSTVTAAGVDRMTEIVEFTAEEIGPVRLDFGMVFTPEWVNLRLVQPPTAEEFIENFARALDRGEEFGVKVGNPNVSIELLLRDPSAPDFHVCLAPPDLLTSYYDVPREKGGPPEAGVFGRWDPRKQDIIIDEDARRRLLGEEDGDEQCRSCPCRAACMAPSGVRGRMPSDEELRKRECRVRVGVLEELLRRKSAQSGGRSVDE